MTIHRVDSAKVSRMSQLVDMILRNDTKGCPDPAGGGCMGHYCTRCAARELQSHLAELARGSGS